MVSQTNEKLSLYSDKFLIFPGMAAVGPISKGFVLWIQLYVVLMTLTAWILDVHDLMYYGIALVAIGSTGSMAYHLAGSRKTEVFIYSGMMTALLVSLYFIMHMGGIMSSGGIVMIGLLYIILSMTLQKNSWTTILTLTYSGTVIYAAIDRTLQPGEPALSNGQNVAFFTMNTIVLGISVLVLVRRSIIQHDKVITAETKLRDEKESRLRAKTRWYTEMTSFLKLRVERILKHVDPAITGNGRNGSTHLQRIEDECLGLMRNMELKLELAEVESRSVRIRKVQTDFIKFSEFITDRFNLEYGADEFLLVHDTSINQFNLDFDPLLIQRIYTYLIADCKRRIETGGEVRITINREQENNWKDLLEINIRDNGNILEENLIRLMNEPDYSNIGEIMAESGPTSAGPMMSAEIVRMLDGKIYVKSSDKKGTRFRILLPAYNSSRFMGTQEMKDLFEEENAESLLNKLSIKESGIEIPAAN